MTRIGKLLGTFRIPNHSHPTQRDQVVTPDPRAVAHTVDKTTASTISLITENIDAAKVVPPQQRVKLPEKAQTDNAVQQQVQPKEGKEQENIKQKVLEQKLEHPEEPIVVVKQPDDEKVAQPATEASKELLRIKGFWPFDFFPNELVIEEKRVIINERFFFWSNQVTTVQISDLSLVEISRSVLFAKLEFYYRYSDRASMRWLKVKEALEAKKILDGLIIAEKSNVAIADDDTSIRRKALEKMGKVELTV